MAGNKLNSFRITVILVVFVILCYVDWSPSAKQRSRRSPLSTRSTTIYNSCQNNGEIGVTFDEGPTENTKLILDILKENNIKATFHLNPSNIKTNIDTAKAIVNDGHLIGLKLDSKLKLEQIKGFSMDEVKEELEKEAKIIMDAINVNPKFLRLPLDLDKNENILKAIDELGFVLTTSAIDFSEKSEIDQYVKLYEDKLKEDYNKDTQTYPKFIDSTQDSLENIPEAWKKIIKLFENYNAKPVTLDVCTGTKDKYRTDSTTSNHNKSDSKSGVSSKTITSISSFILSVIAIIYFLF